MATYAMHLLKLLLSNLFSHALSVNTALLATNTTARLATCAFQVQLSPFQSTVQPARFANKVLTVYSNLTVQVLLVKLIVA